MLPSGVDPQLLRQSMALAAVGAEMVVPVVIGQLIDSYWQVGPWGIVIGAVLGFGGGLYHLIYLANRSNGDTSSDSRP